MRSVFDTRSVRVRLLSVGLPASCPTRRDRDFLERVVFLDGVDMALVDAVERLSLLLKGANVADRFLKTYIAIVLGHPSL